MTAVDEELALVEHLDFEAPCSMPDCEDPARYSLACRFCADVSLGCEQHVRRLIERNNLPGAFECLVCLHIESDLYALVHIHPLRP
jgi:hypothetical protein